MRSAALTLLLLGLSWARPAAAARRVAVVVGISQYQSLPAELQLPAARENARAFLEDEGGYDEVHLLLDGVATREAVQNLLLGTVASELSPGDTLLWAFVGHGIGGDFGDPTLLTWDSHLDDPDGTALHLQDLATALVQKTHGVDLVIVTDAAHDGAANGVAMMGPSAKSWPPVLGNVFLLSAAAPEEVAPDGMFVPLLVEGMRGGADANLDGQVTASELHRHLLVAVAEATGDTVHPAEAGRYDPNLVVSKASRAPVTAVRPIDPTTPAEPVHKRHFGGPVSYSMMGVGALTLGFGFWSYSKALGLCDSSGQTRVCPDTPEYRSQKTKAYVGYGLGGLLLAGGFGLAFVPLDGGGLGSWSATF